MRLHNTHKLPKIGIYKVRNIAIMTVHADLWDTVKLHNLSFYTVLQDFTYLPELMRKERDKKTQSITKWLHFSKHSQ